MATKTKKQKITIDDLAIMVKNGFDEVNSKIDSVKFELGAEIGGVKSELGEVKAELKEFKEENRREHEEIKLRLDNTAHRFELVELGNRVQVLEKRAGILLPNR